MADQAGYDYKVVLGTRDTTQKNFSCMELVETAFEQQGIQVLPRGDNPTVAVLPSNLSNSTTFSPAAMDYPTGNTATPDAGNQTLPAGNSAAASAPYSGADPSAPRASK